MRGWIFDIRSRPFVLLVALFLALTALVMSGATGGADGAAISYLAGEGDPALDVVMLYITESGDILYMMVFGIVVLLVPRTRRIGITLMILIVLSTLLTGYIKCGVDRDRPEPRFDGPGFPVPISRDTYALFCEGSYDASYPSGHAARAMILAVILGYALSERFPRGAYLMLLYPVLMSASRVYVLEHYPMDVVGGAVIGLMLAGVMAKMTKLYRIFGSGSDP